MYCDAFNCTPNNLLLRYAIAFWETGLSRLEVGPGVKFHLIDRITSLEPGKKLVCYKNLTMAEEYLFDHFPGFPVMPGVLMLETLVQAGAWLLRLSEDFRQSMIVLRDARNVKYGTFMDPGNRMEVKVELLERTETGATFKGSGSKNGQSTVNARFTVAAYNLCDSNPGLADGAQRDEALIKGLRLRAGLIWTAKPALG